MLKIKVRSAKKKLRSTRKNSGQKSKDSGPNSKNSGFGIFPYLTKFKKVHKKEACMGMVVVDTYRKGQLFS